MKTEHHARGVSYSPACLQGGLTGPKAPLRWVCLALARWVCLALTRWAHLTIGVAAGAAVAEQADIGWPDRVQGGQGGGERLVHPPPLGRAELRAAGVCEDAPLRVTHSRVMQHAAPEMRA